MRHVRAPVEFFWNNEEGVEEGKIVVHRLDFGFETDQIESPIEELAEVKVPETLESLLLSLMGDLFVEVLLLWLPGGTSSFSLIVRKHAGR